MNVNDFSEIEGLLHLDTKSIEIEFVQRDTVINLFSSKTKGVTLSLNRVSHLLHRKGWFGDKLEIQAKTMKDLAGVPGAKAGKIVLKIKKRYRIAVETIAVEAKLRISQMRVDELNRESDKRLEP